MVDDNAAAGRQRDVVRERRLDLRFDLEAREQRHGVRVQLQLAQVVRHDLFDELGGFLVSPFVVDQDFANLVRKVIAQCAHDGVALAIDQER